MKQLDRLSVLCGVVSEVGRKVFSSRLEHDCFCGHNPMGFDSVHPEIQAYISLAVSEKIERDREEGRLPR